MAGCNYIILTMPLSVGYPYWIVSLRHILISVRLIQARIRVMRMRLSSQLTIWMMSAITDVGGMEYRRMRVITGGLDDSLTGDRISMPIMCISEMP